MLFYDILEAALLLLTYSRINYLLPHCYRCTRHSGTGYK